MKTWKIAAVAAGVALIGSSALAAPPAALKPARVSSAGLNVIDLEGQKAWYITTLGMGLVRTYDRDGKPYEYVLNFGGANTANVVLLASPRRPPGKNLNSRLVLLCPDAKGLAAHLKTQGIESREVVKDVAYFIADPEGNDIELYTPPPAPAKP